MSGHVGLNLVFLVPGETGGMETYARELIPAMAAASPQTRFTAFVNREATEAGPTPWDELMPVVTVPVHARRRTEWVRGEQMLLPRLARKHGIDLLHSLGGTAPARGPQHRVVTVHDLLYRTRPEAHLGVAGWGMKVLVPLAVRRSQLVITPSEASREDVIELLGASPASVEAIPHGVGVAPSVDVTPPSGLDGRPFVLSPAAKRPHKNLSRLLDALAALPPEGRPALVLPGYRTEYEDELRAQASRLGVEDDVRFLGWVDGAELEGLYAEAAGVVLPSLGEGFGLPVLEAMARGVPVACSDRGALREVAGDAALLFDPADTEKIAEALRALAAGGEATRLREAGLARAAEFSWERSAKRHLAAYQRLLSGTPRDGVQQVAPTTGE